MKNVILHGATNFGSSNYGDFIYGEILFEYFRGKGYNVRFYQPSDFFCENISDYKHIKQFKKKEADLVVYIPGGYLGGGVGKIRIRDILIRFFRFFPLGIWAVLHRKKIYIMAVGADPVGNLLLKIGTEMLCNHSEFVTVRDHTSYTIIKKVCRKANVYECGDLILTSKLKEESTLQLSEIMHECKGRKLLLVHYNHSKEALTKFADAVKKFIVRFPEYSVIVTADTALKYEKEYFEEFKKIFGINCYHFTYSTPNALTALIRHCDMILTCKLHVGVIGSSFNKSVVAVACHYSKTKRFYEQLSEGSRCIELQKASSDKILDLLIQYHDKKISIDKRIIDKANESWIILERYLCSLNGEEKNIIS